MKMLHTLSSSPGGSDQNHLKTVKMKIIKLIKIMKKNHHDQNSHSDHYDNENVPSPGRVREAPTLPILAPKCSTQVSFQMSGDCDHHHDSDANHRHHEDKGSFQ